MNKIFIIIALSIFLLPGLTARTLEVGKGKAFARLQDAAKQAKPGDIILMRGGVYEGNDFIANLNGTKNAWITIKAAPREQVLFRGGQFAMQLSNPTYLKIEGLAFEGQTQNGVNIDDGGTYKATAHDVIIENCEWRNMNAIGNNDELKLSGLENFTIRNCRFLNGSKGGSLVDMVGCHDGIIENNVFKNAGADAVQAKGGTKNIIIRQNRFINGGQRGINIGGSTGRAFFRPADAKYEGANIYVYANIFTGSDTPFAFVGAINCEVVNNTVVNPTRWALRILQENITAGMQPCANNSIRNNIFVLSNSSQPAINIGPNTKPETFTFSHNIWYQANGKIDPKTPVQELNALVNVNPQFADSTFKLAPNSPAIGKGQQTKVPAKDFFGKNYSLVRSVGAVEFIKPDKKK